MKTSENISNLADDIEDVLRESDIATPNPAAVGRLKFRSADEAILHILREKAGRIASLADTFYSARKHNSYRNGSSGVLADMKDNLERIRSWAEVWKEKGD